MGLVGDKIKREEILRVTLKAKFLILYTMKKGGRDFCPVHTDYEHAKGIARILKNNGCTDFKILKEKTPEFDGTKKKIISRLKKEIAELETKIG